MKKIILFDGECAFCDSTIKFIIKKDKKANFKFASLQSDIGRRIKEERMINEEIDSVVLVEGEKHYFKSDAALRIARDLKAPWKWCYVFVIVPIPIRDYIYDVVAKSRYKWFGKKKECFLPTEEERGRFL